jgi:hypothetical protein
MDASLLQTWLLWSGRPPLDLGLLLASAAVNARGPGDPERRKLETHPEITQARRRVPFAAWSEHGPHVS